LRLQYMDSWLDNHVNDDLYPDAYSLKLDRESVRDVTKLDNTCTDKTVHPHTNLCEDGTYYNDFSTWFGHLIDGTSVLLMGFPEYFSEILAADPANTNPVAPVRRPTAASAIMGDGNQPYLFTDAFVISKNCVNNDDDGFDCLNAAVAWLNWQRTNYAQKISLGKDLSPVRPRFLAVAQNPFYSSSEFTALPTFAKNHYNFVHGEANRATPLETLHFYANEDTQGAKLRDRITS